MECSVMCLFILIFSCCEYIVISDSEAVSKLYIKIEIKKEDVNVTFVKEAVKGSNISVIFNVNTHIDNAGLIETNKRSTPIWASNSPGHTSIRGGVPTQPSMEVDAYRMSITADFGLITEEHAEWELIILTSGDFCNSFKSDEIPYYCDYVFENQNFIPRHYRLKFRVIDYINVTANNKELKPYSIKGSIPNHILLYYELPYRPGNYTFTCSYLREESVKSLWIGFKNPESKSKEVSHTLALRGDNETTTLSCCFKSDQENQNGANLYIYIMASIQFKYIPASDILTVQINNKTLDNVTSNDVFGETYDIFYQKSDVINITCVPDADSCKTDECLMKMAIAYPIIGKHNEYNYTWHELSGKPIFDTVTLSKKYDGAFVNCIYINNNYENIRTNVRVRFHLTEKIAMTINNIDVESNNIFDIDNDSELVTVNCRATMSSKKQVDGIINYLYLILTKNNDELPNSKTELELNSEEYSGNMVQPVSVKNDDVLKCVVSLDDDDVEIGSINVTVKKIVVVSTMAIFTSSVSPGGHNMIDIPDQPELSSDGILSESWVIYAIISCAGIFIIVIIVCIVKVSTNKSRDSEQLVPREYETMPDTPPPANFPCNVSLEETYCRPSDNMSSEPTYSQPYIPTSPEELYSKPIPKTARKKQPKEPLYASLDTENNYAKVKPKSARNKVVENEEPGYAEVGMFNNEPTYASVQNYANINSEDAKPEEYYNVFNNSCYANSKKNAEYVEPSYCEVSKVRK